MTEFYDLASLTITRATGPEAQPGCLLLPLPGRDGDDTPFLVFEYQGSNMVLPLTAERVATPVSPPSQSRRYIVREPVIRVAPTSFASISAREVEGAAALRDADVTGLLVIYENFGEAWRIAVAGKSDEIPFNRQVDIFSTWEIGWMDNDEFRVVYGHGPAASA